MLSSDAAIRRRSPARRLPAPANIQRDRPERADRPGGPQHARIRSLGAAEVGCEPVADSGADAEAFLDGVGDRGSGSVRVSGGTAVRGLERCLQAGPDD